MIYRIIYRSIWHHILYHIYRIIYHIIWHHTPHHTTQCHVKWYHVSCRLLCGKPYITLYHITSYHIIISYHISYHIAGSATNHGISNTLCWKKHSLPPSQLYHMTYIMPVCSFTRSASHIADCMVNNIISYIISCHIISYHIISYITPYHFIPYHTTSYHIIPHHTISHHIIPYHTTP